MAQETRSSVSPLLKALSAVLAQTAEPVDCLRCILEEAVQLTKAERGVFVEIPTEGVIEYRVLHRIRPRDIEGKAGLYSLGVFEHVLRTGQGICIDDARRHAEFMHRESIARLGFASILCVPIHAGGRIAALVHLEHDRTDHFAPMHQNLLEWLAEVASPMLEALQQGSRMRRDHDSLQLSEISLRLEAEESRLQLKADWSFQRFIGASAGVRKLETRVSKVAILEKPILLLGENGTGKSMLARVLHASSRRASGPFVTVSCPNLAREMMEAELFGNRKGAFTDARADRIGKVQVAEGGTLFLDEIGDLPLDLQPRLLRLVHDNTYEVLGDPHERLANVRVIAATNRNLPEMVETGRFRRDLFERLNFLPIEIPPLRDRREDIPLLMRHCLDANGGRWLQIAAEGLEYLQQLGCSWPGNVRNLEQLAYRLMAEKPEGLVSRDEIEALISPALACTPGEEPFEPNWKTYFAKQEKLWLLHALRIKKDKNLTNAELSRMLGMGEAKLYRKLSEHGLRSTDDGSCNQ